MEDNELKNFAKNIITAYEARVRIVKEIVEDTKKSLEVFKEKREELSGEIRDNLARNCSLRKADFNQMMGDILKMHGQKEERIKKILDEFKQEEETVLEKLSTLLKKGEKMRIRDLRKVVNEFQQSQESKNQNTTLLVSTELEKMKNDMGAMLGNFKEELSSLVGKGNLASGGNSEAGNTNIKF
ncbi:MAG: hypothetical protein AABX65_03700 [Nanoarchaeota archaeon]